MDTEQKKLVEDYLKLKKPKSEETKQKMKLAQQARWRKVKEAYELMKQEESV